MATVAKTRKPKSKLQRWYDNDDAWTVMLGMNFGKAKHLIDKMMIFHLAQKLGPVLCCHCEKPITSVDDCTLEHVTPWRYADNARTLYFDLENNVKLCHEQCNRASVRPRQETDALRTAWYAKHKEAVAKITASKVEKRARNRKVAK
jgi:hypothetical protein